MEGDATGMFESTSPETLDTPGVSDLETPLPSEIATGEHRTDGDDSTFEVALEVGQPGGPGAEQVIAGRYTLLEILGEGGMGTVYRASQTAPVKRKVALKLIKIGMDSRAVLARFDAERQALALMDHPNIARVYDGGTTEAGQPFFVMELVRGEPITEYCDRKRLPVRSRLELFVSACQAVQHAHQKGIIHRDLKPGNVLVTEVDGRATPKVIDFGVAKATEVRLTDLSYADTGAIVGTPAYMSPEQADPSSMDIDTRTDVYALGPPEACAGGVDSTSGVRRPVANSVSCGGQGACAASGGVSPPGGCPRVAPGAAPPARGRAKRGFCSVSPGSSVSAAVCSNAHNLSKVGAVSP